MPKTQLLKDCAQILQTTKVDQWYTRNLKGKSQVHTVNSLEKGVVKGELSVREALSVALIVGVQWDTKFEGVP